MIEGDENPVGKDDISDICDQVLLEHRKNIV